MFLGAGGIHAQPSVGEIKIRAAHEIMAARTTQLALLVDQLMPALRTPPPMLAGNVFVRRRGASFDFVAVGFGFWCVHCVRPNFFPVRDHSFQSTSGGRADNGSCNNRFANSNEFAPFCVGVSTGFDNSLRFSEKQDFFRIFGSSWVISVKFPMAIWT